MRADFQQYYGLNIDEAGEAYTLTHAAALAPMLPPESRTITAACPEASWSLDRALAAATANAVRDLVWLEADAKRRASNRPKPILPPKERVQTDVLPVEADDYLAQLKRMRGGGDADRAC